MAERHGPCLPTEKDADFQDQVPEEPCPHLLHDATDQQLGVKLDQLPYEPTGTSSCNWQEKQT